MPMKIFVSAINDWEVKCQDVKCMKIKYSKDSMGKKNIKKYCSIREHFKDKMGFSVKTSKYTKSKQNDRNNDCIFALRRRWYIKSIYQVCNSMTK